MHVTINAGPTTRVRQLGVENLTRGSAPYDVLNVCQITRCTSQQTGDV